MDKVKELLNENKRLRNKIIDLMRIQEKVEELNQYVKNSLVITNFGGVGWEIRSYINGTLFESGEFEDKVIGNTFEDAVNKAYRIMLEDKVKGD